MEFIGIDVSKDTFHVAWNEVAKVSVFANNKEGIKSFENSLHHRQFKKDSTKIGLESTGIYHLLICVLLTKHEWNVNVINPYITSKAIKASLRHVKTDAKDARTIRKVLIEGHGYPFTDTSEILELKAIFREYNALKKLIVRCKHHIHIQKIYQSTTKENTESSFPQIYAYLDDNLKQMKKRLESTQSNTQILLQSIPGIGPICSAALIAYIGNINRFDSPQKLVAYIGLDCRVHQSGTSINGKGFLTKRGNPILRSFLFNAAYVARQYNPDLKRYFEKKTGEGKHYYVAVCAVERKLVHIIYAVWKRGTPFVKK
ncbi:MAG: IS110 family transposase [Candidatus Peribacteraceae bacterium]|nr:IS110 family transposase [Candidatus Peribacteraceae bacterium]